MAGRMQDEAIKAQRARRGGARGCARARQCSGADRDINGPSLINLSEEKFQTTKDHNNRVNIIPWNIKISS